MEQYIILYYILSILSIAPIAALCLWSLTIPVVCDNISICDKTDNYVNIIIILSDTSRRKLSHLFKMGNFRSRLCYCSPPKSSRLCSVWLADQQGWWGSYLQGWYFWGGSARRTSLGTLQGQVVAAGWRGGRKCMANNQRFVLTVFAIIENYMILKSACLSCFSL